MSTVPLEARADCVQGSTLFRGIAPTDCAEIVLRAKERRFAKHETIFRQGDPVKFIFLLVSGWVKITETSQGGADVILSMRSSGEVVGGLGLAPNSPHTRTAQALERCHMLVWEAGDFQTLAERYPALALNSSQILSERLQILEERFHELATQPVAPRLARTLVRLLEQSQSGTQKPAPIGLTHEELAQMTGMTSFTVSRLLSEWEQRGIIASHRRSVLIKDLLGLRTLAKGAA
jgi:CRP-like cAMP-binding protein